LKSTINSENFK